MSMTGRRIVWCVLLVLSFAFPAMGAPPPSDADRATARELGAAGVAALDAKDYPTAVERLSRAIALYDAPTLRLARARALRGMGRLVSASEDYRAILLRTPSANDPPVVVQATKDAKAELPDVEAGVAHLTVTTSGPAAIRVDGVDWPAAAIGVPRPLDPGDHLVEAAANGQQLQSQKITLSVGQTARVDIPVPAATGESPPPAQGAPPSGFAATPPPQTADLGASQRSPAADKTTAIITTVIAGALATGAVVTGIVALSKKSDFDQKNVPTVDHATKEDLRSQAKNMALVSTVLTAGAIVVGGFAIYLFVSPSHTEPSPAPHTASGGVDLGFVLSKGF
jgi:hypothetical protein